VRPPAKFARSFDVPNESSQEAKSDQEQVENLRRKRTRSDAAPRVYRPRGGLTLATRAFAQANSPWENAVNVLQQAFTGPIAKGLALIAIVIGGLTFAFGEGGSKRTFAGILFGLGMALLAVNFLSWLFGV